MVIQPLPEIAQNRAIGVDGEAQVDPIAAQLAILSEEKRKAKEYQMNAKAAKDDQPKLYDKGRDYSFLKVRSFGQVQNHIIAYKIETNVTTFQRGFCLLEPTCEFVHPPWAEALRAHFTIESNAHDRHEQLYGGGGNRNNRGGGNKLKIPTTKGAGDVVDGDQQQHQAQPSPLPGKEQLPSNPIITIINQCKSIKAPMGRDAY